MGYSFYFKPGLGFCQPPHQKFWYEVNKKQGETRLKIIVGARGLEPRTFTMSM